jgi:hypothetical protein
MHGNTSRQFDQALPYHSRFVEGQIVGPMQRFQSRNTREAQTESNSAWFCVANGAHGATRPAS